MIKIGKQAPDFSCEAVVYGKFQRVSLADYADCYKLLFFYPLDFTFVCPTELHALQENLSEFENRNIQVLGISVDSVHAHMAWLNTPKTRGGIDGVSFPLLSDIHKTISRAYDVLHEDAGISLRGVFLIDKNNVVQYAAVNNLALGRNVKELLRVADALMHVEKNGEVCPANWSAGDRAMVATRDGVVEYFNP
jgi:peroxiredoxin (alkyl hydroperoxide reductase subunit C)